MNKHARIALLILGGCAASVDSQTAVTSELATRMGVDYSLDRPSPGGLFAAGYTFAARYVSFVTGRKNITASEASALHGAGIDIVINWETNAEDALGGFNAGVRDATEAKRQAAAVGQPGDRPIYFAIDFDASEAQQPAINAYFDGVASVIGAARVGAYAGYFPIKRLFDAGKIRWGWQTFAWSGGQWDPRAQLRQVQIEVRIAGGDCDIDQAMASDFGQWGSGGDDGGGGGGAVIPGPCATADDGIYCGESTQGGFGETEAGSPGRLYTCIAGADREETQCRTSCVIAAANVPDHCNPDPCAHASDGTFCGGSMQLGFDSGNASSFVLYTCSGGRTSRSRFCTNGCMIEDEGVADHCN